MKSKIQIGKRELIIKCLVVLFVAIALGVSLLFSHQIEAKLGIGLTNHKSNYVSVDALGDDKFVVHYIDVGQADCTFVEFPDGKNMMIDTGRTNSAQDVVDYVKGVLGSKKKIDYLIITHGDEDHVGGASAVLDYFDVETIFRPFAIAGVFSDSAFEPIAAEDLGSVYLDMMSSSDEIVKENAENLPQVDSDVYIATIAKIYEEKVGGVPSNVIVNFDGYEMSNSVYSVKWYAPLCSLDKNNNKTILSGRTKGCVTKGYGADSTQGRNAISPVVKIEYKANKFVFSGDIYTTAEKDVLKSLTATEKQELSNVTVYQAGHHGASNSNSKDWLKLLNPTYTVVSCGLNNKYKHPSQEFLDRLQSLDHSVSDYLLRTDLQKTIVFGVDENGKVAYAANVKLNQIVFEIAWWHVAAGILVVTVVLVFGIRVPGVKNLPKRKSRANRS